MEHSDQPKLLNFQAESTIGKVVVENLPDKRQWVHVVETPDMKQKVDSIRNKYKEPLHAMGNTQVSVLTGYFVNPDGDITLQYASGATGLDKEEVAKLQPDDLNLGEGVIIKMFPNAIAKVQEILTFKSFDYAKYFTEIDQTRLIQIDVKKDLDKDMFHKNANASSQKVKNRILTIESIDHLDGKLRIGIADSFFVFSEIPDTPEASINIGDQMVFILKDRESYLSDASEVSEIFLVNRTLASRKN